ncbi:permease prefix domain 1-containing protein [Microbacterium halophytorum]|uniref:permease prefix domain 1-containing protein n=1 Tax=Microbacterium halophytorum TaxID=2067568 RepID=UPI000CFD948D|nr:permease prefix domain 1-containing protein [Microbacterium halophytorum]
MTSTLTDRYIAATLRGISPDAHDDVRRELGASIADAVEARVEQGEAPDAAERAALEELGDPARLAAGLSDRPLQLIGPRYYLTWLRLLRLLLAFVPVSIGLLATIEPIGNGESIGIIVAEFFAAGVTTAMHVFFWTTLGFAVAERIALADQNTRVPAADPTAAPSDRDRRASAWTVEQLPSRTRRGAAWTVDQLPKAVAAHRSLADPIATAIVLAATAVGFWWDHAVGWIVLDGEVVEIFSPGLWPWWIAGLFGVFALSIAFQIVLYIRGRWTTSLAVANTALNLIGVSWLLTLLGRGDLFNPRLIDIIVERTGVGPEVLTVVAVVIGVGGAAIAAGGIADGWVKRARTVRCGD